MNRRIVGIAAAAVSISPAPSAQSGSVMTSGSKAKPLLLEKNGASSACGAILLPEDSPSSSAQKTMGLSISF